MAETSVPAEEEPARSSWTALVLAHARRAPDARAIVSPTDTWTYGELVGCAGTAAALIRGLGLPPGAALPGLVEGVGDAVALAIGGSAAGHPYAPLGTRLTVAELAAVVDRLGTSALAAAPAHRALAEDVAAKAGVSVVEVDRLAAGDPPTVPGPDDPIAILHTSGTTGLPKQVRIVEKVLAARLHTLDGLATLGPGDTYLVASGFHHVAGFGNVALGLGLGATVANFPRFSPAAWAAMADHGVTHALTVPSMIVDMLEARVLDAHPALRLLIYGGGPMRPDVLVEVMETLPKTGLLQLFGQTEGTPITALTPADHELARSGRPELLRSVGKAAPGVTIHLEGVDADGIGEVYARGPHLNKIEDDGWQHTGDLGHLDEEGYLYLDGRTGDTINRGGENVRPAEVEEVLRAHPSVKEVAVVGLPDRRLGELVAAFVVRRDPGQPLDEEALRAHTRSTLAGFKVPQKWIAVDDLPRNANGKVLRRVLAAQEVS